MEKVEGFDRWPKAVRDAVEQAEANAAQSAQEAGPTGVSDPPVGAQEVNE